MGFSSQKSKKKHRSLSEINVTPLVDVMLVLLIIFMVAAPMMTMGVEVDLPKVKTSQMKIDTEKLLLTIDKDRQVFLGEDLIKKENLNDVLSNNVKLRDDGAVYIQADANVPYGFVLQIFTMVKNAGVVKVGLVTHPLAVEDKEK